jgi:hypothetical protein
MLHAKFLQSDPEDLQLRDIPELLRMYKDLAFQVEKLKRELDAVKSKDKKDNPTEVT